MANAYDSVARRIFEAAMSEDRCGELFECLIDGGSATVDTTTGKLALASNDILRQLAGGGDDRG